MKKTGIIKHCLHCGKPFFKNLCRLKIGKGKYCSKKCYWAHPKSEETLKRMSECQKGKKYTLETIEKRVSQTRGENHWNWKGGISSTERMDDIKWKNLRKLIYQRDNWTCQRCGKHCHNNIQCHHIIPYRVGKNYRFIYWNVSVDDESNLITLCKSCHGTVEREYQRKEVMGIYALPAILHTVSSL
jgi:5-methylcytosine-specific restriction endonuclease McrA